MHHEVKKTNGSFFWIFLILLFVFGSLPGLYNSDKDLEEFETNSVRTIESKADLDKIINWFKEHEPRRKIKSENDSISFRINGADKLHVIQQSINSDTYTYEVKTQRASILPLIPSNLETNYNEVARIASLIKAL